MKRRAQARRTEGQSTSSLQVIRISLEDVYGGMISARTEQDESLAPLAASIARHGLLQPVLLRRSVRNGRYAVVCGARRVAACRLLGYREIDALLLDADPPEAAACFIEEELTRWAPCAMDQAQMLAAAGKEALLENTSIERTHLERLLELNGLAQGVQRIVCRSGLSLEQAYPLLRVKNEARQMEAAQIIAERSLTSAQARRLVFGPQRQHEESVCGRRRAVRLALEEVSRIAQSMRLRGVETSVRVHSQDGGMCVQIHFAHGEKQ